MEKLLAFAGSVAAVAGIALCLFVGVLRLAGMNKIVSFELMTFFIVGIAFMAIGILAKLHHIIGLLQK